MEQNLMGQIIMRLFIAVEIPESVREKLTSFQGKIGNETAMIKWVETENIHLTLKFLGDVDESRVDSIKESLKSVKLEPFECSVKGFGVFPNEDYIKVMWAGIGPEIPFRKLHEQIDKVLEPFGFEKDSRFHPHVTIGRVRFVKDKKGLIDAINALKDVEIGHEFKIENFKLKKSTLTPEGPVYEDVAMFNL